jgi:LuxR family transcriptional regulator, quorum-sensing system regulator CciR
MTRSVAASQAPLNHAELPIVRDFVAGARKAEGMVELRALIEAACREIGIDFFAIVHHIRFGRPSTNMVRLSNYPTELLAHLRQEDPARDPVLRAAERSSAGFLWDRLGDLIRLDEADHARFRRWKRHGLGEGFTVPSHVPGEAFGSCHFTVRNGRAFPERSIYAAQSIGCFAFAAARELNARKAEPSGNYVEPAPLTGRQRDCLVLAARGKSDSVIAQLLDIRPRTVNEHIEAAKRRYAVATRSQLMVRALFRSEILYSEVLG